MEENAQSGGTRFKPRCRFWQQGICKFGDYCRYGHPKDSPQSPLTDYPTATKRTSSAAGITFDTPSKKVQVHKCPSPPPALERVFAVIREVTTTSTESRTFSNSYYGQKIKSVAETIIEKETRCDVSGAYTSVEEANKKVVKLLREEGEERREFIKEVTDVGDGRVSWVLETECNRVQVNIKMFELDDLDEKAPAQAEDEEEAEEDDDDDEEEDEVEIYLGGGRGIGESSVY